MPAVHFNHLSAFPHLAEPAQLIVAGLAIGAAGGLLLPGDRFKPWLCALVIGAGAALCGGFIVRATFGGGFGYLRFTLSVLVSALFVGTYALVQRARALLE
jgi:hypothetical protein